MYNLYLICLSLLLITPIYYKPTPKVSKLKGIYRIGPHNKDVISVIFGSLLGGAHGEKRILGVGTRFCFYQEAVHVTYLMFLHKLFSDLGYCNSKLPIITTRFSLDFLSKGASGMRVFLFFLFRFRSAFLSSAAAVLCDASRGATTMVHIHGFLKHKLPLNLLPRNVHN